MIRARVLNAAEAQGPVLVLDEPLSFWGAFEPRTGVILDVYDQVHTEGEHADR